jgi:hypothetical protein
MSNQQDEDILRVDKDGNISGNEEFWTSVLWGVAGGAVLLVVLNLVSDMLSSNNNQVEVDVSNDVSWTQRVSVDGSGIRVISSNGSIIVTNSNGSSRSIISGSGNSTVVVNGNSVQVAGGEVWINGKKVEPEVAGQSNAR